MDAIMDSKVSLYPDLAFTREQTWTRDYSTPFTGRPGAELRTGLFLGTLYAIGLSLRPATARNSPFLGLFLLAAVCHVHCQPGCSRKQVEYKIAVLAPLEPNAVKFLNQLYVDKAVSLVVRDLNSHCAVKGYNLTYEIFDTECHPGVMLQQMAKARENGAKAFIGPACEFNCIYAADLARVWHMTMLSYACFSTVLSDRDRFPTFARTVPTFLEIGRFIGAILMYFEWEKVTMVTTSDNLHVWLELFDEISRNYPGEIPQRWITDDTNEQKRIDELEHHMTLSYVFVLCMFPREVRSFLKMVEENGYYQNRVYITIDFANSYDLDYTGLLDITVGGAMYLQDYTNFFKSINCKETCSIVDAVQNNLAPLCGEPDLGFRNTSILCCNNCQKIQIESFENMTDLCKVAEQVNVNISKVCSQKPENKEAVLHASLIADAIKLLADALNTIVKKKLSLSQLSQGIAQAIMSALLERQPKMKGNTGYICINNDGTRRVELSLHNLVDGVYRTAGRSVFAPDGHNVSYKVEPNSIGMVWPGGGRTTPTCPPTICPVSKDIDIVILILSSTGLLLILIFLACYCIIRRRKSKKRDWLISSKKLYSAPAFTGKLGMLMGGSISKTGDQKKAGGWGRQGHRAVKDSAAENTLNLSRDSLRSFAMGQIFTKVTVLNQQLVAVKPVLKPSLELTAAVIQEIKQVRHLKHTNVNQLVGACIEPDHICLVWFYCAKGSLRDVLNNDNIKLDWTFKLSFISDIAKGMAYLHTTPVKVHGRLKSTNVLVDKNWCCKLADFSMPYFRQGAEEPITTAFYFGLLWTAPELLRDIHLMTNGTKKGDVYSFAIIMQEIVTRKNPFLLKNEESAKGIVRRVAVKEKPPFRPYWAKIVEIGMREKDAKQGVLDLMLMCWDEYHLLRLPFNTICRNLRNIREDFGTVSNLVDEMLVMVRKYADNLEELVEERTRQLEEEQLKTEELLSRMLPKSVAHDLKRGLSVIPECYLSVTLYFSDIMEFSEIAQTSTPIQVVNLLNDLYTCFDNVIDRYDVYKVETIADNYVVSSGLPVRNGDQHASEIATMALDLLTNVLTFRMKHLPHQQLLLRIGIHTGPVVAGVVGKKMPRYCLFGDTVNYTSRVESNGKALHIHVSPECKQRLDQLGGFYLVERGYVEMKGKGQILTYFLVGKKGLECKVPYLSSEVTDLIGINVNNYQPYPTSEINPEGYRSALETFLSGQFS